MLLSVYAHFVLLGLIISNSKSARLVWLPRDQWYRGHKILKDCIKVWTFTVTLTTQNASVYDDVPSNQIIWSQKDQQFSRYGRNSHIWLYDPSLWPWTWRQQTNLLVWHSGPWRCITMPSLVTKGSAVEEISRWTFTTLLYCNLVFGHNRAIKSVSKTMQLMIMCHKTKFSRKRIGSSEDILESNISIIWSFTVTWSWRQRTKLFGRQSGS